METEDAKIDSRLMTLFNYDEIFGTIVNRFIVQAVVGYPLTVYGKGGQTRGHLNINDTLQCVHMSEKNPAKKGELRIFNQIMETFSANDLAEMTQRVGNKLGYDVQINHIENPRKEEDFFIFSKKIQVHKLLDKSDEMGEHTYPIVDKRRNHEVVGNILDYSPILNASRKSPAHIRRIYVTTLAQAGAHKAIERMKIKIEAREKKRKEENE